MLHGPRTNQAMGRDWGCSNLSGLINGTRSINSNTNGICVAVLKKLVDTLASARPLGLTETTPKK